MQKLKRGTGKMTVFPSCCIGIVTGVAVTLAAAAVFAVFINREYIALDAVAVIGVVIQFCSVQLGSVLAARIVKEDKFLCCIAVASVYYIVLLCTAMLFCNGLSGSVFSGLAACVTGCATALLVNRRRKARSVHKKNKFTYR